MALPSRTKFGSFSFAGGHAKRLRRPAVRLAVATLGLTCGKDYYRKLNDTSPSLVGEFRLPPGSLADGERHDGEDCDALHAIRR